MKKLSLVLFIALLFFAKDAFSQSYDFELNDLNGNPVKLSELLKKGPVFISFWATWCIPCKEEMREMNIIYNKYKDSGFVYVAIDRDDLKSISKVKPYIESKGYNFIVLYDTEGSVFESFGGQQIPFAVLMNKKGEILHTYSTGYTAGDEIQLEKDVVEALHQSDSGTK
jgi:cytochrome c biogenesis protein CcmG/thiol:disulfide interchange protein DsbE